MKTSQKTPLASSPRPPSSSYLRFSKDAAISLGFMLALIQSAMGICDWNYEWLDVCVKFLLVVLLVILFGRLEDHCVKNAPVSSLYEALGAFVVYISAALVVGVVEAVFRWECDYVTFGGSWLCDMVFTLTGALLFLFVMLVQLSDERENRPAKSP